MSNKIQPNGINVKCETKHVQMHLLIIPIPKTCLTSCPLYLNGCLCHSVVAQGETFISPPQLMSNLATGPVDRSRSLTFQMGNPGPFFTLPSRSQQNLAPGAHSSSSMTCSCIGFSPFPVSCPQSLTPASWTSSQINGIRLCFSGNPE